jgi:hypothetical protein
MNEGTKEEPKKTRDEFALAFAIDKNSQVNILGRPYEADYIASEAYLLADAMIARRDRLKGDDKGSQR